MIYETLTHHYTTTTSISHAYISVICNAVKIFFLGFQS